jgi:oligopeptide/dipeptide ABC transporter ATP-binding protein
MINIGIIVLDSIFGAIVLIILAVIIQTLNSIEFRIKREKVILISLFPIIYSILIVFIIRCFNSIYNFLPENSEFYLAIMSNIFCALLYFYFNKYVNINMENANPMELLGRFSILFRTRNTEPYTEEEDKLYQKFNRKIRIYYILIISIAWVVASLSLFFDLNNIDIPLEFEFGFQWSLIIIIISMFLTNIGNRLIPIEKRFSQDIKSPSMVAAGLLVYGIWSLQLLVLGMIFNIYFHLVMYFVIIPIFLLFFLIIYKRFYKPKAAKIVKIELEKTVAKTPASEEDNQTLLRIEGLKTYFYTEEGVVRAVEDVSFSIFEDEIVGLVGETGCGKSVTALSILQLIPNPGKIESGKIIFKGENLLQKSIKEIQSFRGNQITMIFQDPLNSINPVFKVGAQISEVYLLHQQYELLAEVVENEKKLNKIQESINDCNSKDLTDAEKLNKLEKEYKRLLKYSSIYSVARQWGQDLLKSVGISDPEQVYDRYPHELSGGMRQRVMIAMGLACSPKLLIADEPTTALDVTIEKQILKLMKELKEKYKTSILFITHDLGIISRMCDRVAVMYSGYIVEYGAKIDLFTRPKHPYTHGLIKSKPVVGKKRETLPIIRGMVPNLIYPPSGCRFHPRCEYCFEPCDTVIPKQIEVAPNYFVACHLYDPRYQDESESILNKLKNIDKEK